MDQQRNEFTPACVHDWLHDVYDDQWRRLCARTLPVWSDFIFKLKKNSAGILFNTEHDDNVNFILE